MSVKTWTMLTASTILLLPFTAAPAMAFGFQSVLTALVSAFAAAVGRLLSSAI